MRKLFPQELQEKANQFIRCTSLFDLENLDFDIDQIKLLSLSPPYYYFKMKKSRGGYREIEAPELNLKEVQRQFNEYLQCVYYTVQSPAAYGYIIKVRHKKVRKNILGNANFHHGAVYMLNIDFKDFFHQISSKKILNLFQNRPFQFDKKSANILKNLFCKNGRLPMGAPTSPVLSNLAVLDLDAELLHWANERNILYSRFVDDMTFSSKSKAFNNLMLDEIQAICHKHQLILNPQKTKFYGADDTKMVTGLVLNETVDIDPDFYKVLNKNLKRLRHLAEVNLMVNKHRQDEIFRKFKQEVEGQINFIGMIEGYDSKLFWEHRQKMKDAITPDDDEIFSVKWTNFNYF